MKINEPQRVGLFRAYPQSAELRQEPASGKRRKDEVQISDEAKELLGAQSGDRESRIRELKNEVSSGTYRVDAGKIAEKLLPFFLK
jgi:negative regulator of flagellin synthesis FlgM